MFKRVILKLSGEALACEAGSNFDETKIRGIARQLKRVVEAGVQTGIVVGGGNFWRGRSSAPHLDRYKSDQIGMLATIMNAVYLMDIFRAEGVPAYIMTPFSVGEISEQFTKGKAIEYMHGGNVVIFAGGTGHPYFSTDTAVALRGLELDCDALLFAKNGIECLYDEDPHINPNANKLSHITFETIVTNNKINAIDTAAACICLEGNLSAVVFGMDEPENIYKAAMGEKIGTYVSVNS